MRVVAAMGGDVAIHAIMLRFSWSIHVNTEPAGASFGAYRSNHIFRPEAPRRAAAGSETGLLFVLCHGLLPASACPLCGRGRRWRLRWPSVDSSHTIARPESMR